MSREEELSKKIEMLIEHSKHLKQTAEQSKTKPKRDLYLKKLKKNNNRIANYFLMLNSLSASKE